MSDKSVKSNSNRESASSRSSTKLAQLFAARLWLAQI
jgi:hypothetical protein